MNSPRRSHHWDLPGVFVKANRLGKIVLILASWFGSGLMPKAPGTFGTLAAIPLVFIMNLLGIYFGSLFLIAFLFLAVWASESSRILLEKEDPSEVVIDEAVGLLMTVFLLPLSVPVVILGFILFRVSDILKPFPIRMIDQNIKGGWGIVLDDVVAGIYANVCIRLLLLLFPQLSDF